MHLYNQCRQSEESTSHSERRRRTIINLNDHFRLNNEEVSKCNESLSLCSEWRRKIWSWNQSLVRSFFSFLSISKMSLRIYLFFFDADNQHDKKKVAIQKCSHSTISKDEILFVGIPGRTDLNNNRSMNEIFIVIDISQSWYKRILLFNVRHRE